MTHNELREALERLVRERLTDEERDLTANELDVLARLLTHEIATAWFETPQAHALLIDPRRS